MPDRPRRRGPALRGDVSQVEVAAKYSGTARFVSTPRAVGELAHVAGDLRADGTFTEGELDTRIGLVE